MHRSREVLCYTCKWEEFIYSYWENSWTLQTVGNGLTILKTHWNFDHMFANDMVFLVRILVDQFDDK